MSDNTPPATAPDNPQPADSAGFVLPPDPHAGKGGSYVINPETGARELIERTAEKGADHGH
ncbi:MAG TPA: hypothetical protein VJ572_01825 [Azonexus sp.]|nr:hypothetical protein [Azonexus sp.]